MLIERFLTPCSSFLGSLIEKEEKFFYNPDINVIITVDSGSIMIFNKGDILNRVSSPKETYIIKEIFYDSKTLGVEKIG